VSQLLIQVAGRTAPPAKQVAILQHVLSVAPDPHFLTAIVFFVLLDAVSAVVTVLVAAWLVLQVITMTKLVPVVWPAVKTAHHAPVKFVQLAWTVIL